MPIATLIGTSVQANCEPEVLGDGGQAQSLNGTRNDARELGLAGAQRYGILRRRPRLDGARAAQARTPSPRLP
eukprot:13174049-Alexandrium_andersonii.AAC.1